MFGLVPIVYKHAKTYIWGCSHKFGSKCSHIWPNLHLPSALPPPAPTYAGTSNEHATIHKRWLRRCAHMDLLCGCGQNGAMSLDRHQEIVHGVHDEKTPLEENDSSAKPNTGRRNERGMGCTNGNHSETHNNQPLWFKSLNANKTLCLGMLENGFNRKGHGMYKRKPQRKTL